jgi:hypothetical protein
LNLKDNFTKVLKKANNSVEKTSTKLTKSFKKATESIKAGWIAIGIAIAFAVKWMKNLIFLTGEAQRAQARLTTQFKNVGIASEENFEKINQLANKLQDLTGISNDQIISSAALAASYNLNFEQVEKLLPALVDLAAFTAKASGSQVQMEDTVKLMGFVLEGQIGRLKLMGITMSDVQKEMIATGTRAEKLAAFLEAVEVNAGGVAEAMGDTAIGSINRFGNALDDLKKTIGEELLPVLADVAETFTKIFAESGAQLEANELFRESVKLFEEGKISLEEFGKIKDSFFKLSPGTQNFLKQTKDLKKLFNDITKEERALLAVDKQIAETREKNLKLSNDQIDSLIGQIEQERLLAMSEEELGDRLETINEEIEKRIDNVLRAQSLSFEASQEEQTNIDEEKNKLVELNEEKETLLQNIAKRNALTEETNELIEEQISKTERLAILQKEVTDLAISAIVEGKASIASGELVGEVEGIQEAFKKWKEESVETEKTVEEKLKETKKKVDEVGKSQEELNKEFGERQIESIEESQEARDKYIEDLTTIQARIDAIRESIIRLNETPITNNAFDVNI